MPKEAARRLVETIEAALEEFKESYGLNEADAEEDHYEIEERMVGRGRRRRPRVFFRKKEEEEY